MLRAMDNPHELPRLMTDTEIVYEDPNGLAGYMEKLRALTSQDLQAVAAQYFKEENYSTATLIPK
jgi:predicted Zn-dependent peptidase